MIKFAFIFLLFCSALSQARDIAFFWGGGGEPSGQPRTIFDSDFNSLVPALVNKGWEVRTLFGYGHFHSENLVKRYLPGQKITPFLESEAKEQIHQILTEAKRGEVRRVFIIISSHGVESHSQSLAHKVKATDSKGIKNVDLQILIPLRDTLEALKVPLAILDLSCFSGATLDLSSRNTCVVSSSSSQEYSYSQFARSFTRELLSQKNFEKAFLSARKDSFDFSSPEISTLKNSLIKLHLAKRGLNQFPHKSYAYCSSCRIHEGLLKKFAMSPLLSLPEEIQPEVERMIKLRTQAKAALNDYKNTQISFEEMDNLKSRMLNQHFYVEKRVYEYLYEKIQVSEQSSCQQWQL